MVGNKDSLVLHVLGAFPLTALAAPLLSLNSLMTFDLYFATLLLTFIYFTIGLLIFKFRRSKHLLTALLLLGYTFPCAVLILSLTIPAIIPHLANLELMIVLLFMVGVLFLLWFNGKTDLFRILDLTHRSQTGAIEITEIPSQYLERGVTSSTSTDRAPEVLPLKRMQNILRSLLAARIPVGLRLQRFRQRTRLLFLTWATNPAELQERLNRLENTLKAHLPGFTFRRHNKLPTPDPYVGFEGSSSHLTGVPYVPTKPHPLGLGEVLTTVAEALHTSNTHCMLQVFVEPIRQASLTSWRQRRQHTKSTTTQTLRLGFGGNTTRTHEESGGMRERPLSPQELRHLQRLSNPHLSKVHVTATAWHNSPYTAREQAKTLLRLLQGSLTPEYPARGFKVHTHNFLTRGRATRRLLRGNPVGKTTLLTPKEAALYFAPPRCTLDIPIIERHRFAPATTQTPLPPPPVTSASATPRPSASANSASIILGYPLRNGRPQPHPLRISPDTCGVHIGLWGQTGKGKTTTALSLTYQLYKCGVNPVILVPEKVVDWRRLLDLIPGLRLFTAGNEQIAPLRFNPFQVPPGVSVNRQITGVTAAFIAAWPTEGIIKEHVENLIETTYTQCEWDRRANNPGRPILLPDLQRALQTISQHDLQYSSRLNQDFWGALTARINTLLRNPVLTDMYNTTQGLTIPELLQHPTIIEMRDLSEEQRSLLTALITTGITNYLEAQSTQTPTPRKGVRYALILEEAHHFLRRTPPSAGLAEGHSARQQAINTFVNLLRQARGHGLSVMYLDQLPGKMTEEAVKLPGITIIHALKDPHERALVGRQANCTDQQLRHITGMKPGEAIIHLPGQTQPINIQVTPLNALLKRQPPAQVWTDTKLHQHMKQIYTQHPRLLQTEPLPPPQDISTVTRALVTPAEEELEIPLLAKLVRIIRHPRFAAQYQTYLETAKQGQPRTAARYLIAIVKQVVTNPATTPRYSLFLLSYLAQNPVVTGHTSQYTSLLQATLEELDTQEQPHHAS